MKSVMMEVNMSNLKIWNPSSDLLNFHNSIDDLFETAFPINDFWSSKESFLSSDLLETEKEFELKVSLPGIDPKKVEISVVGDTLTIHGDMEEEQITNEKNYHMKERRSGSYTRSYVIPSKIDFEKSTAEYQNGVLKILLPKAEIEKKKTITIKAK